MYNWDAFCFNSFMRINLPKNDTKTLPRDSFRRERAGFVSSRGKNSRGIAVAMSRNFSEGGGRIQNLQQKLNHEGGSQYHWTNHVAGKMVYYGLSADRVKRVVRSPYRSEKGIAPNTIAVMQPSGHVSSSLISRNNKKPARGGPGKQLSWKEEIWVMYVPIRSKRSLGTESRILDSSTKSSPDFGRIGTTKKVIITAWRYPGVSKIREAIPIPENILAELKNIKY